MYFGSVRFFKHVILTTVTLLILIPTAFAIFFFYKTDKLDRSLNEALASNGKISVALSDTTAELNELKEATTEPVVDDKRVSGVVAAEGDSVDYQKLFPEMVVEPAIKRDTGDKKIIYLTFDDGPSQRTLEVLDLLDLYEIKATFFVVYKNDEFSNSVYKEIVSRGHAIGVHSASHDYKKIYASVEAYLTDFHKMYQHIYELTGEKTSLFRFPGGSINSYNDGIYMEIIAEMTRRGFVYHDWNVSGQDASDKATDKTIYSMVVEAALKHDRSVVLLHDSSNRAPTVKALPRIIDELYAKGYNFYKLDAGVTPFLFSYNKPF